MTDETWRGEILDVSDPAQLLDSVERYDGSIWDVRTDRVRLPGGAVVERDVVHHPGAVGILALDRDDRVLLIRQYRQPVGGYLFELPAGLRDVAEEHPLATAQRELAEEAGLMAARWDVLVDFYNSPGGSTEAFRCFLARELSDIDGGRPRTGEAEEHHLPQAWVPLVDAVDMVLEGRLHNPTSVAGVLAAAAARDRGWTTLRAADSAMWELPDRTDHCDDLES